MPIDTSGWLIPNGPPISWPRGGDLHKAKRFQSSCLNSRRSIICLFTETIVSSRNGLSWCACLWYIITSLKFPFSLRENNKHIKLCCLSVLLHNSWLCGMKGNVSKEYFRLYSPKESELPQKRTFPIWKTLASFWTILNWRHKPLCSSVSWYVAEALVSETHVWLFGSDLHWSGSVQWRQLFLTFAQVINMFSHYKTR